MSWGPMQNRKAQHIRRMAAAETAEDWKALAVERCRIVAAEFGEEYREQTEPLLDRVDVWEAAGGLAVTAGWAVYHHLGLLRVASGEQLFRRPESLVLDLITSQPMEPHRTK